MFHNAKRAIVYNAQDAKVSELAAEAQTAEGCRKVGFTLEAPQAGQIGIEDGWIVDRSGVAGGAVGESVRLAAITDFTHLAEPDGSLYPHLVADALTALALVLGLGADRDTALKALTSFKPGGHRIETVAEAAVEGGSVRFVDDSKATNGHAARASLSSFPAKSVIWIAGGLAKGSRFEDLVKDQAHTIKAAVIIGKDQQPMIEAFASQAPDIPVTIIDPEDNDTVMDRAVEACGTYTAAGDIVLMAPACAPWTSSSPTRIEAIDSRRSQDVERGAWPPLIPISVRHTESLTSPHSKSLTTRVGEACSTRYGATTLPHGRGGADMLRPDHGVLQLHGHHGRTGQVAVPSASEPGRVLPDRLGAGLRGIDDAGDVLETDRRALCGGCLPVAGADLYSFGYRRLWQQRLAEPRLHHYPAG